MQRQKMFLKVLGNKYIRIRIAAGFFMTFQTLSDASLIFCMYVDINNVITFYLGFIIRNCVLKIILQVTNLGKQGKCGSNMYVPFMYAPFCVKLEWEGRVCNKISNMVVMGEFSLNHPLLIFIFGPLACQKGPMLMSEESLRHNGSYHSAETPCSGKIWFSSYAQKCPRPIRLQNSLKLEYILNYTV